MDKSPDAFRSIGEVSRLVGVAPHVLRYWETQFTHLSPVKRGDGRRYYRPEDIKLVAGLCQVMREEGLSIRGAKRLISADRGASLRQIGAARLGSILRELPREDEAPESAATESDAAPAAETVRNPEVRRPAPRRRQPDPDRDSLPLFPEPPPAEPRDPLERLCDAAQGLRRLEREGVALPPQAHALRELLRAQI